MAKDGHIKGGTGADALLDGLADRDHQRGTLRMIQQAYERGDIGLYDLKRLIPAMEAVVGDLLEKSGKANDRRTQIRVLELIRKMRQDNLLTAEKLDHTSRLDGGEATERVDTELRIAFDERPEPRRMTESLNGE